MIKLVRHVPISFLKKFCLEPGVLFPIANLFVFVQSDSRLAVGCAVVNILMSGFALLDKRMNISPLRITAWMVLLSGLSSFWSGSLLPAFAGFSFAIGLFLNSTSSVMADLHNPILAARLKVLRHPALYYGLGYSIMGVMAGGGMRLFLHPLAHFSGLVMVGIGMTTIMISSFGLAINRMRSATPFWILAGGTAINVMAGLWSGNIVGATSCLFSMLGELRLGCLARATLKQHALGEHHGL